MPIIYNKMKILRVLLSIMFLVIGMGLLLLLISHGSGTNTAIGDFFFSSYSYLSYVLPIFYLWIFFILTDKSYNPSRFIWPVVTFVPFYIFAKGLQIQLWDQSSELAMPMSSLASIIGTRDTVYAIYILGVLLLIGEVLAYFFVGKNINSSLKALPITNQSEYYANQQLDAPHELPQGTPNTSRATATDNYQFFAVPHVSAYPVTSTTPPLQEHVASQGYTEQQESHSAQELERRLEPKTEQKSEQKLDSYLLILNKKKSMRSQAQKHSLLKKAKASSNTSLEIKPSHILRATTPTLIEKPLSLTEHHLAKSANEYSNANNGYTSTAQSAKVDVQLLHSINKLKAEVAENTVTIANSENTNSENISNNSSSIGAMAEANAVDLAIKASAASATATMAEDYAENTAEAHRNILDEFREDTTVVDAISEEFTNTPLHGELVTDFTDSEFDAESDNAVIEEEPQEPFREVLDESFDEDAFNEYIENDYEDFEGEDSAQHESHEEAIAIDDKDDYFETIVLDEAYNAMDDDAVQSEHEAIADYEKEGVPNDKASLEDTGTSVFADAVLENAIVEELEKSPVESTDAVASTAEYIVENSTEDYTEDFLEAQEDFVDSEDPADEYIEPLSNEYDIASLENSYEDMPQVQVEEQRKPRGAYKIPIFGVLDPPVDQQKMDSNLTESVGRLLEVTLQEFNIDAKVMSVFQGPVVTMFEILPAPGVRLSRIEGLSDNIALRLAAQSIRIIAPIPGKEAVGIEVPNKTREMVSFAELITDKQFQKKEVALPIALGKNITDDIQIVDLSRTPHLLIAGATGSGKSVCINSIICSLLYRCSPDEVKLILIDPKIVELSFYNGIAHLLTPVISDATKSLQALRWCVVEMERRYQLLEALNVREIRNYNKKLAAKGVPKQQHLPFIVLVIDEFADLMMTCGKEIESLVSRLTAKSRAIGIHLVVATQRPSTDVITGLIKSNIPTRISFMVTSKTDSRIILDMNGAESLLGKGDMLYSSASDPFPERLQGPYLSEDEVQRIVEYVKDIAGSPEYISDEMFMQDSDNQSAENSIVDDPLWEEAVEEVIRVQKASASHLQRRFKIGYNRAARLVEEMEEKGIIGPQQGSKPREVYSSSEVA